MDVSDEEEQDGSNEEENDGDNEEEKRDSEEEEKAMKKRRGTNEEKKAMQKRGIEAIRREEGNMKKRRHCLKRRTGGCNEGGN